MTAARLRGATDARALSPGRLAAIAVMAKAPMPGKVKTRLVPPLSPEEARLLSAAFLRDMTTNVARAAAAAPLRGYVAYAPAGAAMLFEGMLAPGTGLLLADGAIPAPPEVRGFGLSLLHAARGLFAKGYGAACLLNSDSPTLPTGRLVEAAQALARPGERIVLGPADDGGYYLLGLKAPQAHLFADIRWSSAHVATETAARAEALGLEVVRLDPWYDVDERASLERLVEELAALPGGEEPGAAPFAAPATAACVARLSLAARLERRALVAAAAQPAARLAP